MKHTSYMALVAAIGSFVTVATPVCAATARTAVSVNGVDTNPCTPAAPCRSINYALTQTSPGGELFVLNSGGYGAFTITQSVTIIAPGGNLAALTAASGNGITISAGPSDQVFLDGFFIDGSGTGTAGIKVNSVGSVYIGHSAIFGFATGIDFSPTNTAQTTGLTIDAIKVFNTPTATVSVAPIGGLQAAHAARAYIGNSDFYGGPLVFDSSSAVSRVAAQINGSSIHNGASIVANSSGSGSYVQIMRASVFETPTVFSANGANATILFGDSNISHVGTIANPQNGGAVYSFGTNQMYNYTATGSISVRALQ